MRYLVWLFCLLSLTASAQMSHEETVVRTAYAKFAYACQQGTMIDISLEGMGIDGVTNTTGLTNDQRLANARVTFSLGNFETGDASKVLGEKTVDLITASPEMLSATKKVTGYSEGGSVFPMHALDPRWTPTSALPPEPEMTLSTLLRLQWQRKNPNVTWLRYASYTVSASYAGKTRGPYKALFLFGRDSAGDEMIEPADGTVDSQLLAVVLAEPLFPDGFVRTRVRNDPAIAHWVAENQMSCSAEQGDVCCDLVRLQCGLSRDDVARGLARPFPVPTHKQH
jgi:hypothetical protein